MWEESCEGKQKCFHFGASSSFSDKKVRDSINSHSPDPKKTQKLKKFFFQQLPEKSDWLSATIDGGPPWDSPPSLSRKKTRRIRSFPEFITAEKRRARAGQRFFFFTFRPLAWVRVCSVAEKSRVRCCVKRGERIQFRCRWFFSWTKKRTKNLTPGSEGGKRRENYIPRFPLLNARKHSEGKIRLLYTGKTNRRRRRVLGQNDRKIPSLLGGYAPRHPFSTRERERWWCFDSPLSLKVGEVR